jgi:hypothetical protein
MLLVAEPLLLHKATPCGLASLKMIMFQLPKTVFPPFVIGEVDFWIFWIFWIFTFLQFVIDWKNNFKTNASYAEISFLKIKKKSLNMVKFFFK